MWAKLLPGCAAMIRTWMTAGATAFALTSGLLILAVVLVTVVNVTGYTLDAWLSPIGLSVPGLPGYEDAVALLTGVAALLMMPYCQMTRGHVAVDLLTARLSPASERVITRVTDGLTGIIATFLTIMMFRGGWQFAGDGTLSPVLGWPIWPFLIPATLGCGFWAMIAISAAVNPDIAHTDQGKNENETVQNGGNVDA